MCALKGGLWSQHFLAETVEAGVNNSDVSQHHALFFEEGLGKIDVKVVALFWNRSGQEFYRLKALIDYFGTSEYLRENFDGIRAIIWSGVVHFNFMEMISCGERAVYFQ